MTTPRPVNREIARLREIVANSSDAMIFGGGEVSPDETLPDLCAEALHLFNDAKRSRVEADLAYHELNRAHRQDRIDSPAHQKWQQLCADASRQPEGKTVAPSSRQAARDDSRRHLCEGAGCASFSNRGGGFGEVDGRGFHRQ